MRTLNPPDLLQSSDRLQQSHRGAQLEPEDAGEVRLAEQGQGRPLQGVLAEYLQEKEERLNPNVEKDARLGSVGRVTPESEFPIDSFGDSSFFPKRRLSLSLFPSALPQRKVGDSHAGVRIARKVRGAVAGPPPQREGKGKRGKRQGGRRF